MHISWAPGTMTLELLAVLGRIPLLEHPLELSQELCESARPQEMCTSKSSCSGIPAVLCVQANVLTVPLRIMVSFRWEKNSKTIKSNH